MPYEYSDQGWDKAKRKLRALLVSRARDQGVITYSQLTMRLTSIRFEPNDFVFHRMLDEISTAEDEAGRHLLTTIVVHKDDEMLPGPGFFELAESRGRDVSDIDATWLAEFRAVLSYWKTH